jgi:hypothetical protein
VSRHPGSMRCLKRRQRRLRLRLVGATAALFATCALAVPARADHPSEWITQAHGAPRALQDLALLESLSAGPPLPGLSVGGPRTSLRSGAAASGRTTPTDYGDCGPGALPETGLQGQVPRPDQDSGRSRQGYVCNVHLVGENDILNRGANFQLTRHEECAYVGIVGAREYQSPPQPPGDELEGIAVIDASDPSDPELVEVMRSSVGRSQHEALEVHPGREILVTQIGGLVARWIEIYDVSDCRKPVLLSRYDAGSDVFHGMRLSDDGRTIYASDSFIGPSLGDVLHVIDISDPANPQLITEWNPSSDAGMAAFGIHDLEVSADGARAYLGAVPPSSYVGTIVTGPPSTLGGPSLVTLDTTAIQERSASPELPVVAELELPNFGHTVLRAQIGGQPYLFSSGETPFGNPENCPWAWGHVIDNSEERTPRAVAEIKLEVNELDNCGTTTQDAAVYSIHYAGVDDETDTSTLFYTYYSGGLRVFDVRDPANPKEIAYYHPEPVPGSVLRPISPTTGDAHTPTWDSATSDVHFDPRSGEIWVATIGRGFQILELEPCLYELRGGAGSDKLDGTAIGDAIRGLQGRDSLDGGPGEDCLTAGPGRDRTGGGFGDDEIRLGRAADRGSGGDGDDVIKAGPGRDRVRGGGGSDGVRTKDGRSDRIRCGSGRDVAIVDRIDRTKGCERVRHKRD